METEHNLQGHRDIANVAERVPFPRPIDKKRKEKLEVRSDETNRLS
jgi:hypothetical protein